MSYTSSKIEISSSAKTWIWPNVIICLQRVRGLAGPIVSCKWIDQQRMQCGRQTFHSHHSEDHLTPDMSGYISLRTSTCNLNLQRAFRFGFQDQLLISTSQTSQLQLLQCMQDGIHCSLHSPALLLLSAGPLLCSSKW